MTSKVDRRPRQDNIYIYEQMEMGHLYSKELVPSGHYKPEGGGKIKEKTKSK